MTAGGAVVIALAAVGVVLPLALLARAEWNRRADIRAVDRILTRMAAERLGRARAALARCEGCGTPPGRRCWVHLADCNYALVNRDGVSDADALAAYNAAEERRLAIKRARFLEHYGSGPGNRV